MKRFISLVVLFLLMSVSVTAKHFENYDRDYITVSATIFMNEQW